MPDAAEIEHYARHADTTSDAIPAEGNRLRYLTEARESLPPRPTAGVWVGDADAVGAQLAAFEHLAPIAGARVLQIGGNGCHGLTMAAAGAESVVQVSHVVAELDWCRSVAHRGDLSERPRGGAATP